MQKRGGVSIPSPKPTSHQGAAPAASARRLPWQGWSSRRRPPPGPPHRLQTWEQPLTFGAGELAEGGQRDDGVGDGVHRVQHAGDVVGAAGLDAADGVCLLLAEPEESHSTRGVGRVEPGHPQRQGPGPGREAAGWAAAPAPGWLRHGPPSPAALRGCFRVLLQIGLGVEPPRHTPVSNCSSQDKRSFAIYQLHELSFSFHNCKSHSFIHLLNKSVGTVCWVPHTRDTKSKQGRQGPAFLGPRVGGAVTGKACSPLPHTKQSNLQCHVRDGRGGAA